MTIWQKIIAKFGSARTENQDKEPGLEGSTRLSFIRRHPVLISALALPFLAGTVLFVYFYLHYSRLIDHKLGSAEGAPINSSVYAAAKLLTPGLELPPEQLIAHLQRAGYTESPSNPLGHYRRTGGQVEITTGRASYFEPHTVRVQYKKEKVSEIFSVTEKRPTDQYWLEPELVTNLHGDQRSKRRPVAFSEFPPHLVQAVVSIEDKRFFDHWGLDLLRVAKAAYVDLKERRMEQGASTLTMQLSRSFWLDSDKTWGRKIAEAMLALELERRYDKQKIFELYGNEVYLGRRGSFSVHGFGEAARSYFGKDIRNLEIHEAATLAGLIQRPSYFNPFRYPERMLKRRNLVLGLMHSNGYITAAQLQAAKAQPIKLEPAGDLESTDAPYFVDLVNHELESRFADWDFDRNAFRIYSTLDLDLQRFAVEAVDEAMKSVDKRLAAVRGRKDKKLPHAQVALIALDPHTGAIKALVGGRSYRESQLNRTRAMRQPGSSFKPFVYAAALSRALTDPEHGVTAGTALIDEPTQFTFNQKLYEPANFGGRYLGPVTVRTALKYSLNIPVIKVAERVGYDRVVQLARQAGIKAPLEGTPSIALGSYEVPPLEIAEAYTIFANSGVHMDRYWVNTIRDRNNAEVYRHKPTPKQVLDEKVAYLVTDMLQDVVRGGTAAALNSKFRIPTAGKTGTSHDGWFVGYTSELLTVVWVGYDDYRELELEGSKTALPVWAAFMKRAHTLPQFADAKPFKQPDGLTRVTIDPHTGLRASDFCDRRDELFIRGTEPRETCTSDHYYDFYETAGDGIRDGEDSPTELRAPRRTWAGRVLEVFR